MLLLLPSLRRLASRSEAKSINQDHAAGETKDSVHHQAARASQDDQEARQAEDLAGDPGRHLRLPGAGGGGLLPGARQDRPVQL